MKNDAKVCNAEYAQPEEETHLDSATNIVNSRWHTYFAEMADGAEKLLDNFKDAGVI
jgi:hypothetical protein